MGFTPFPPGNGAALPSTANTLRRKELLMMDLNVKTLTGNEFTLRVGAYEPVVSVKTKIFYQEGIPVSQQHLIWQSTVLEDALTLFEYNITNGCSLQLVLQMRGGPINTRRVRDESVLKEMAELVDGREDLLQKIFEVREKSTPVTLLLYKNGDRLSVIEVQTDRDSGANDGDLLGDCDDDEEERLASSFAEAAMRCHNKEPVPPISSVTEKIRDNALLRLKMKQLRAKQHRVANRKENQDITDDNTKSRTESEICLPAASADIFEREDNSVGDDYYSKITTIMKTSSCSDTDDRELSAEKNSGESCAISSSATTLPKLGNLSVSSKEHVDPQKLPSVPCQYDRGAVTEIVTAISSSTSRMTPPVKPATVTVSSSMDDSIHKGKSGSVKSSLSLNLQIDVDENVRNEVETVTQAHPPIQSPSHISLRSTVSATSTIDKVHCVDDPSTHTCPKPTVCAISDCTRESPLAPLVCDPVINSTAPSIMSKLSEAKIAEVGIISNETEKPSRARCVVCNKKLLLAARYTCRCDGVFCPKHRYAEAHNCCYDYRTQGRRQIDEENPVVAAEKLPKI